MKIKAEQIYQAYERIWPFVRKTPLEYSPGLSRIVDAEVYLKLENWQHSGSFKPRGSFNRLLKMSDGERSRGIVAPTAGNHGVGLSFAAAAMGVDAHIYLPRTADPAKLKMLDANGAKVSFFESVEEARTAALQTAESEGMTFLSAYNDVAMIEGGGTVGVEVLDEKPDIDLALVCVGGGGLIAGIGTVFKAAGNGKTVWGFQTDNSPQMKTSFETGQPVAIDHRPSIAEGISGRFELENMTFPVIKNVVDAIHTVSDDELKSAVRWMFENHQMVTEPSGVPGVAYLLRGPREAAGRKIMITITGRNVAPEKFLDFVGTAGHDGHAA